MARRSVGWRGTRIHAGEQNSILRRWAWGDGPDWVACEREIAENAEKARPNAREGDGWESEGGAEWRRRRVYKG